MSGGGLTPNVPMSVNSFLPSFGILGSPEPSALNLKNFNNNISENPAAGQAVNHRSLRDYNATGLVNNNISGNPVAGPALAHNDSNNKKFKELCKKAILAIRGICSILLLNKCFLFKTICYCQ
jgi:hypothetical protein